MNQKNAIPFDLMEKARFFYVKKRMGCKTIAKYLEVAPQQVRFWKARAKALGDDWELSKQNLKPLENQEKDLEDLAKEIMEDLALGVKGTLETLKEEPLDAKNKTSILSNLSQSYSRAIEANRKLMPKSSEFATAIKVLGLFSQYLELNAPDLLSDFTIHLENFAKDLQKTLNS